MTDPILQLIILFDRLIAAKTIILDFRIARGGHAVFHRLLARPQHRRQRFWIRQPMVVPDVDQRRAIDAAVPDKFLTMSERDHPIGS